MQHVMGIDGVIVDLVEEITEAFSELAGDGEEDPFSPAADGKLPALRPKFSQRELTFLLKLIPELVHHSWMIVVIIVLREQDRKKMKREDSGAITPFSFSALLLPSEMLEIIEWRPLQFAPSLSYRDGFSSLSSGLSTE